jgi:hypothetical protein
MAPSNQATWIGSVGVGLLLLAFGGNLLGLVPTGSYSYIALNLAGALLACYSSFLIRFYPFVILEGIWALAAAVTLAKQLLGRAA